MSLNAKEGSTKLEGRTIELSVEKKISGARGSSGEPRPRGGSAI